MGDLLSQRNRQRSRMRRNGPEVLPGGRPGAATTRRATARRATATLAAAGLFRPSCKQRAHRTTLVDVVFEDAREILEPHAVVKNRLATLRRQEHCEVRWRSVARVYRANEHVGARLAAS